MSRNKIDILENNMLVYTNNLLGYFNANNVYIINSEVIEDLINQEKTILSKDGNVLKCNSYLYGFGNINYEITYNTDSVNAVCELYVVENVSKINGYLKCPLKTKIAVYQNKNDEEFIKKVIYTFNLVEDATCLEQPNLEDSFKSYIYIRKNYNEKLYLKEQDSYNKMFKGLFETQLKYFSKGKSAFCKDVYKLFLEMQSALKNNLKLNKKTDYFSLFELMNVCIKDCVSQNPKYKNDYKEYHNNIMIAVQFANKQVQEINKNFKQNQTKLMQKDTDKEKSSKNVNDLLKVLNNKEKTKNDNRLIFDNVYIFGNINNFNNLEVDGLKQLKAYINGDLGAFLDLKSLQTESSKQILDFFEKITNEFRKDLGLNQKDFDGDGKIENLKENIFTNINIDEQDLHLLQKNDFSYKIDNINDKNVLKNIFEGDVNIKPEINNNFKMENDFNNVIDRDVDVPTQE